MSILDAVFFHPEVIHHQKNDSEQFLGWFSNENRKFCIFNISSVLPPIEFFSKNQLKLYRNSWKFERKSYLILKKMWLYFFCTQNYVKLEKIRVKNPDQVSSAILRIQNSRFLLESIQKMVQKIIYHGF